MVDSCSVEAFLEKGSVRWATRDAELGGYTPIEWPVVEGWIDAARGQAMRRASLQSPAQPWLDWLNDVDRLAVLGVDIEGPEAVADLLGFVVEPAMRRGIDLLIVARQEIEDLDTETFVEPRFGYPFSLERLRWRLRGAPQPRVAAPQLADTGFGPDSAQESAVKASEGVVQIIAPAGSGKTTVLIERVRELRRWEVPAEGIACVTFNRAAKEELEERLMAAGVGSVEAFTFHSLGRRILIDAGKLRKDQDIRSPTLSQWRLLATKAMKEVEDGVFIKPSDAAERLSQIKLGMLQTPEEYATAVADGQDPQERTMAALYRLYEELQHEQGQVDFDDLVLKAYLVLRDDE
jgi:DNA helicase-2/ATP-dependent DNA helicase PcrA